MNKIIVVGTDLISAIVARIYAEAKYQVDLYQYYEDFAGVYNDYLYDKDFVVSKYLPQIINSNEDDLIKLLKKCGELSNFRHKLQFVINGLIISLPINFLTIKKLFINEGQEIINSLIAKFPKRDYIYLNEIADVANPNIKLLYESISKVVYNNLIFNFPDNYHVPIILSYDDLDAFFDYKYCCVPNDGYVNLIKKMINHPNIHQHLQHVSMLHIINNKLYLENDLIDDSTEVFYNGSIDKIIDYEFGFLSYYTVNQHYTIYHQHVYQDVPIYFYLNSIPFYQNVEYKNFFIKNNNAQPYTIVGTATIELGDEHNKNLLPIFANFENNDLYQKYYEVISQFKNLHLIGPIANFRNCSLDEQYQLIAKKIMKLPKNPTTKIKKGSKMKNKKS